MSLPSLLLGLVWRLNLGRKILVIVVHDLQHVWLVEYIDGVTDL